MALFPEEEGSAETAGAGADDTYFLSGIRLNMRTEFVDRVEVAVGGKSLEVVDTHGIPFIEEVAAAGYFAGADTDAATDGGQRVRLLDKPDGFVVHPLLYQGDIALYVDTGGAGLLAGSHTVGVVVAEQEVEGGLTRLTDAVVVGVDLHTLRELRGAGRLKSAHAFYFDDADIAGGIGLQAWVVAEGWDLDAVALCKVVDRFGSCAFDVFSVEDDIEFVHSLLWFAPTLPSPVRGRVGSPGLLC
jgi:hypothetical protein